MSDAAPESPVNPAHPPAVEPHDRVMAVIEIFLCSSIPTQLAITLLLRQAGMTLTNAAGIFSLLLLDSVVVIALMLTLMHAHGERASAVWLGTRPVGRELVIGLLTAPLLYLGAAILLNTIRLVVPSLHNVADNPLERLATNAQQSALFAFVAVLAGGIREELQRGFMLRRFEQHLGGGRVGLVVTSVVFGLLHGIQGRDAMIVTGCLGAFWAAMYLSRRSTIGPMASHAGFDSLQILRLAIGGAT